MSRTIRFGLLASLLVGVVACGSVSGGGSGPSVTLSTNGSTIVGSSSGGPSTVGSASVPDYDHGATAPVVLISEVDATVAGVQGVATTVLYGDGTLLRPNKSGDGWTRSQVGPEVIGRLLAKASSSGLFGDGDPGEPGITDQGWTTVTITAAGGAHQYRVYAPGYEQGLSPAQLAVRKQLAEFQATVAGLSGSDLIEGPAAYQVDRLRVNIEPGVAPADEPVEKAWPKQVPLRETFGDTGCAVLSGEQLRAMTEIVGPTDGEMAGPVLLRTGLKLPAVVRVRAYPLLPHDPGCQQRRRVAELPSPWPGDDRRPADAWSTWLAWQVVTEAAAQGRFGGEELSQTQLTWFAVSYSRATVSGREVIDAVGKRTRSTTTLGQTEFAVRMDATSGEILQVTSH